MGRSCCCANACITRPHATRVLRRRVMRELAAYEERAAEAQTASSPPPDPEPAASLQQQQPATGEACWYSLVVCTASARGAGLAPPDAAVFVALHGAAERSQRVRLPAQAGDFQAGQQDAFRLQLPGVGALERVVLSVSCPAGEARWGLEVVEVTEEATGERMRAGGGGVGPARRGSACTSPISAHPRMCTPARRMARSIRAPCCPPPAPPLLPSQP